MRKPLNRIWNYACKRKLISVLPGIEDKLRLYRKSSSTTGTQWITLWLAVNAITKIKPKNILESGTGASTLVLAEAVRVVQERDKNYKPLITSMESVERWCQIAKDSLPSEYSDIVEIIYGARKKFEWSLFRGYIHDSIPDRQYDFIFLDGPDYEDEYGTTFCADFLYVAEQSKQPVIHGVIDGRTSSAFVLQSLLGVKAARYFLPNLACTFTMHPHSIWRSFCSTDFHSTLNGRLRLHPRAMGFNKSDEKNT